MFSLLLGESLTAAAVTIPSDFQTLCEQLGLNDLTTMDDLVEEVWTQCELVLQRHLPMMQSLGSQVNLHMTWRHTHFIQLPQLFHSLCQVFCHGYVYISERFHS